MLRHYLEVKAEYPDAILLYRMGDFYELFFEDAVEAAPILEVTLTARQKGSDSEAPMCGVPHHALGTYLSKLLRAGMKVAICDQVEDPAQAKGLVKREVTRVVTPGTVTDPDLLTGDRANYLACVLWSKDSGAGALLDVSTGDFSIRRWSQPEDAIDDLSIMQPEEILFAEDGLPAVLDEWIETRGICRTPLADGDLPDARRSQQLLERQLNTSTLKGFGLQDGELAVRAAAGALRYARETQRSELSHVAAPRVGEAQNHLVLDSITAANLEIFRNLRDGRRKGSLLWVLDRTSTPAGGRLLREWLQRPLRDPAAIEARQDAVEELLESGRRRSRLIERLAKVGDLERIVSRAVLGLLHPREAAALRDGLHQIPSILSELTDAAAGELRQIGAADPLTELSDRLLTTLETEPAATLKNGGVIRQGVDEELDRQRSLAKDSRKHVLAMERAERERTGISSLKIRFNKVFGYYLEVTKANQDMVPEDYVRKQTLVNSERYITPRLKELEEQILTAEEAQVALEREYFADLERTIASDASRVRQLSHAIATLDVLVGFAEVAARGRYRRPQVGAAGDPIVLREGRHPVVEKMSREAFVPNDCDLDSQEAQIVILTGPNMGGKSTYLRQNALIVLMAQIGCFVPAGEARLGAVDRIFTRVGASDDLSRGESTFMVEMIETARILHQCTSESLVILDEVGRGTATFDGLSLAWAIIEYLHQHRRPMTLFATHYHELTELAVLLPGVINRTLSVKEWEDRIVFLRRVVPGTSDKSYGLHVARLAGIPESVIHRASEILHNLEAQEYDMAGKPRLARGTSPIEGETADQLSLFAAAEEVAISILREVDLESLTPLAALNLLHALRQRIDGE